MSEDDEVTQHEEPVKPEPPASRSRSKSKGLKKSKQSKKAQESVDAAHDIDAALKDLGLDAGPAPTAAPQALHQGQTFSFEIDKKLLSPDQGVDCSHRHDNLFPSKLLLSSWVWVLASTHPPPGNRLRSQNGARCICRAPCNIRVVRSGAGRPPAEGPTRAKPSRPATAHPRPPAESAGRPPPI